MNLIMKDQADKTWLHPAQRTQKMHGFILMICVLGLFGLTVYASINTALSSPLVNISHYALVDQNGEE